MRRFHASWLVAPGKTTEFSQTWHHMISTFAQRINRGYRVSWSKSSLPPFLSQTPFRFGPFGGPLEFGGACSPNAGLDINHGFRYYESNTTQEMPPLPVTLDGKKPFQDIVGGRCPPAVLVGIVTIWQQSFICLSGLSWLWWFRLIRSCVRVDVVAVFLLQSTGSWKTFLSVISFSQSKTRTQKTSSHYFIVVIQGWSRGSRR